MLFRDQTFEEVFIHDYMTFAKKYHLEVEKSNEKCMLLVSDHYILQFHVVSKGLFVTYFRVKDKKSYDITNYIYHLADEPERMKDHHAQATQLDIEEVEEELPILRDSLDAHLSGMLLDDSSWFDQYKKSKWFRPATFVSFD